MSKRILMVVAVSGLAACGAGEELGEEDAATAWPTTQKALNGGTSSSSAPGALTSTTFTHDCADGGKANFEASVDTNIDFGDISPTSTATTVDYTVTFKKCKVDGVVTVGDLAFTLETNTSDTGAETVWTYDGDLAYRGDVKGTCLVNMTGRAAANLGGAALEYEGSVCGNDAALTLNANSEGANIDGSVDGEDVTGGI